MLHVPVLLWTFQLPTKDAKAAPSDEDRAGE